MKWFILDTEKVKYQFIFTTNQLISIWGASVIIATFIGYFIGIKR